MTARLDDFGGPDSYNHYAVGWAHAMDTPYQWTKQVASHFGGTRNGMITHWPNGFRSSGELRQPVPPRDRPGPDHPGGRGAARAGQRQRRAADAAARRQHGLLLRRRGRGRPARDPVLRDVRQPRHLPQGLDRGDQAQDALDPGRRAGAGLRRRPLGAVRHHHRLEPGPRPVRGAPRQAPRAPAPVADRGDQVQRAAAGRPGRRAPQPGPGRAPGAHQGQLPAAVRRHGAAHRRARWSTSRTSPTRSPPSWSCPRPAPKG